MRRLQRGLGITLLFALLGVLSVAAQEEPYEPLLARALIREGWSQTEAGEMVRLMSQKGWDSAPGDPQAVAFAMGAVLQSRHQYTTQEMARFAWAVAAAGGALERLGYESRDIAAACASSTQTMLQTGNRTQNQASDNEMAERIRITARLRIQDGTHLELKTQTRTQTHTGPGVPGAAPGDGHGPGPGGPGNKPE